MANELADIVTTYTWHDINGNKRFDVGEVNFDRNGPDFVARRKSRSATRWRARCPTRTRESR